MNLFSFNIKKTIFFIGILMINAGTQAQTPAGFNLVAYEGFNYTSGSSLLAANGGSGWSGAWSKSYKDRVLKTGTTGFSYSGLTTSGLKAEFNSSCSGDCNEITALGRSFPLQDKGVIYFQFISVFEATATGGTPTIRLSNGGVGSGVIGAQTGSLMSICSPAANLSSSTASLSAQNLVVVRIDYNLNKTEMWVNPNLSTFDYSNPPSSNASATSFAPAFDRFDIFIRSGSIDEISIFAQPTAAPTSISGTTTVCSGNSTTLTSSGGNLSSEGIDTWYEGACGGDAFHEGFDTQPGSTAATTINSNVNGILNVTTTTSDPIIDLFNLGSFDPTLYKYINFRYRVVSGTANQGQIFFLNGAMTAGNSSKVIWYSLISDGQWHTSTVDMSTHALWTSDGNITGIRYDYTTASGVTMDLDFIELSAVPIVGTGPSLTISPAATTTYFVNRKGYNVNTTCVSQVVTVNPVPAAPTATAIQRFCPSDTVGSLQATVGAGETLAWFANPTGGSALSAATTLAAGNYYAQASNVLGCSSARTQVVVSFNNALYFDGVDDYVSLTSNSIPDGATAFTIEAWIKPDNSNFDGTYHAIFGNQTGATPDTRNPSFYLKSGGVHLDSYEDGTLTRFALLSPASEILQNVWSHIAFVKEANLFSVYVNGQLSFTAPAPTNVNITGPYQLGFIDNYFAGKMDEIRFWSVARTASQIASNMNQFLSGTETGLVDYYTFDQGIQNGSNAGLTTLNDITASVNNGTLNNFALTGTTSNYVPGYFAQITGTSTIELGTSSQLSHVISGGSWTSSNTSTATVSNAGLVTSVAAGTTTVSYSSCGQTTTVTITVTSTPPTITSFAPIVAGTGESVVITGTNFDSVTQVQFGSVSASSFTIDSPTQITAVVAAGSSGNVTLTKAGANVALAGFIYKIVEYNFNSNALDETGSNRDGSISGGVTFGTGVEGQSACFDRSTSNYIALPNNLIRSLSDFTISLRFKTSSKGIILGYQQAAVDASVSSQFIPIIMVQSGGKLRATLWKTTGGDISVLSSNLVNDGNWHKVDMSVTPTSISFYLDGLLVGSDSGTVDHLNMQVNQIGRGYTSSNRDDGGTPLMSGWQGFTGCIDNFLILDKGQSLATITQVTQLPVPTLTSFTPAICNIGDTVTITGTNFTGATSVLMGSIPVTNFTVVSDTQITAVTAVAQVSTISVITAGGTAVSATNLTVNKLNPSLSNFNNTTKKYFDATYTLIPPTSTIAEAFSYSSSDLNVATISGAVVTITGAGTATITATQAGNSDYNSASITATLTVTSVSVLTVGGGISSTNLNYVNQYGQIGGNFGLSANGAVLATKTPPPIVSAGLVLNLDAGNTTSFPGTGTTWTDLSGNGNHGTLRNGVTFNNANDGSLVFDGVNDYISTPVDADLQVMPSTTWAGWIKPSGVSAWQVVFGMEDGYWDRVLLIEPGGLGLSMGHTSERWQTGTFVNPSAWQHVVVIYDNGTMRFYLNGVEYTTATLEGNHSSSGTFTIGANQNGGGNFYSGNIAQVLIYNRVLTAAEIQQNYNAVKLKYGL